MTAIVIPSLGGRHVTACLEAVAALDPAPASVVLVLSGGAEVPETPVGVEVLSTSRRLGFAAAANAGIERVRRAADRVALLNDDAVPAPGWLAPLTTALDADPKLASVQGTVYSRGGDRIDGRGIGLDRYGLPVQVDRGRPATPEPVEPKALLAVSATAALYRTEALARARLSDGSVFDTRFGAYHEDLDLGLRLRRVGWRSAWVPGAWATHLGSVSGARLRWRHPWWLLANRWRALAGNLTFDAVIRAAPKLARGELRAVRTLARDNPRAPLVAAAVAAVLPWLVAAALARRSAGPRVTDLLEVSP